MFYVIFYFKDPTFLLLFGKQSQKTNKKLDSWARKIAEQALGCLQGIQEHLRYLYPLGELDSAHRDNEHLTSLQPE